MTIQPNQLSLLKEFVSALEKLKQLEPIQFRYKEEIDPTQALRAGFSAQQVQQVIPEAVVEVDGVLMLDMNILKNYLRLAKEELLEASSKSQLT